MLYHTDATGKAMLYHTDGKVKLCSITLEMGCNCYEGDILWKLAAILKKMNLTLTPLMEW